MEGAPIGGNQRSVPVEDGDAFVEGPDELGLGMEVHDQILLKTHRKQMVLDLLRRNPDQSQGVLLVEVAVTGDVQHPQHPAMGIEDRGGGAGQGMVGQGEVASTMHHHGSLFHQSRPDGIGATGFLGPQPSGRQGDLFRLGREGRVPD